MKPTSGPFPRNRKILVIILIQCCMLSFTLGQGAGRESDDAALAKADTALNETYKRAMSRATSAALQESLKKSQRAWLAMRDANALLAESLRPSDSAFKKTQLANESDERTNLLFLWGRDNKRPAAVEEEAEEQDRKQKETVAAAREMSLLYEASIARSPAAVREPLRISQSAWLNFCLIDAGNLPKDPQRGTDVRESPVSLWEIKKRKAFLYNVSAVLAGDIYPAGHPWKQFEPDTDPSITPNVILPKPPGSEVTSQLGKAGYYGSLSLDMKEGLLVGCGEDLVDFWDVKTRAMIRRVRLNGWGRIRSLKNLGGGYFVFGGDARRVEISLVELHRDSDTPLLERKDQNGNLPRAGIGDASNSEAGRMVCEVYVDQPGSPKGVRIRALTPSLYGDYPQIRFFVVDRDGQWRPYIIPPDLVNKDKTWSISRDGKELLWVSREQTGSRAITLSLPECRLIRTQSLPDRIGTVRAACTAKEDGSYFLQTTSGALWLFNSRRGSLEEAGASLQLPGLTEEEEHWVERWLIGTVDGWCVYGAGSSQGDKSDPTYISQRTLASANAPRQVHEMVKKWGDPSVVALDRSGQFAAVQDSNGLCLYHVSSGQIVEQFGDRSSVSPRFEEAESSGDGRFVTTWNQGENGGLLKILDLTNAEVQQFQVPGDSLRLSEIDVGKLRVTFQEIKQTWNIEKVFDLRSGKFLTADQIEKSEIPNIVEKLANNARIVARHAATHQVLVYEPDKLLLKLIAEEKDNAGAFAWNCLQSTGYNQFDTSAFDHSGRHALHVNCDKFVDTLLMLDLAKPGKAAWSNPLHGHVSHHAFTPDDQLLMFDEKHDRIPVGKLRIVRTATGEETDEYSYQGTCIGISDDASRAFILLDQGVYQIVSLKDGRFEEVVKYLPGFDGSFALLLPSGHYLSQGNALSALSFASEGRSQPAEALDIVYNRPDLVTQALGAPPELVRALRLAYEKRLNRLGISERDPAAGGKPPEVQVDYTKAPLTTEERILRLPVNVVQGGALLAALEVTVNDVPVLGRHGREITGTQKTGFSEPVEIELASGNNKITVWARDTHGLLSNRVSVNVHLTAAHESKALYVLAIGIDDYPGDKHDLGLAKKDAADIAAVFKDIGRVGFAKVETKLIVNTAATREAILGARQFLAGAGVEDQVVVFMAGHGLLDEQYEYRYCTADLDLNHLAQTSVTYDEIESLLDSCHARKRVLLIDTCHAGEGDRDDERLNGMRVLPKGDGSPQLSEPYVAKGISNEGLKITDLLERHFVDLRIGAGAAVLASSAAFQKSTENAAMENGFFTAAILKGLKTRNADLDGNGDVSASELLRFCQEEVAILSDGDQKPVARHVNLADDFVLATFK